MNPAQPTLLLIHGATGNGRMWDPVRRGLEPRWRVLAPDLPGHGSRRAEPFTLESAVATVVAAARSVAPAPLVVGGDSLGGYVSLASASALPRGQLKGLVLSGCSANFDIGGSALRALRRRWLTIRIMSKLLSERFLSSMVGKELRKMGMAPADVDAILTAGLNSAVFGQCVQALQGIDFRARVAAVEQPVLVLNGSKDKIFVDQEDAFVAAARQPERHRFEGVEHGVSLRSAAQFARLVDGFAGRVAIG
jgi:pimeloyl-ACP methyl ester carboxylesterase